MKRMLAFLVLAVLFGWSQVRPAYAGGWAVVTLDHLPAQVVAGQPIEIGFLVRQHGRTLLPGLKPMITASFTGDKNTLHFTAVEQGDVGHYVVTLKLPSAGMWDWSINAFGAFTQPMPPLDVRQAAPATSSSDAVRANSADGAKALPLSLPSPSLPLATSMAGFACALAVLVLWVRTRRQLLIAPLVAAVALSAFSFGVATGQLPSPTQAQMVPATPATGEQGKISQGAALFLAKGCIICHQHAALAAERQAIGTFEVGPNLTGLRRDPVYLRAWLANPPAIKPETQMPTLGLSASEIESLIAFLNAH